MNILVVFFHQNSKYFTREIIIINIYDDRKHYYLLNNFSLKSINLYIITIVIKEILNDLLRLFEVKSINFLMNTLITKGMYENYIILIYKNSI